MDIVRRFSLLIISAIALQGLTILAWAGTNEVSELEHQVKATYLYKFANYVEWPANTFPNADAPVIVGVLNADEIATTLSNLKQVRAAGNRVVEVKILKPGESLNDIQILFIGRQEGVKLKKMLDGIQSQPVLIVTELAGALGMGSTINFVHIDDRIRFEVSVLQTERSGLKISARLLSVAQKIEIGRP